MTQPCEYVYLCNYILCILLIGIVYLCSTFPIMDWCFTALVPVSEINQTYSRRWKLFCALSSILCNNEDYHQHIKQLLVMFCRHNKHYFQQFCHPVPIEKHIHGMEKDRVWGTDHEIYATASFWQIKVNVCIPVLSCSSYFWIHFNSLSNITIPIQCQRIPSPLGVFHFELYYVFDAITMLLLGLMAAKQTIRYHSPKLRTLVWRLFYNSMYHYMWSDLWKPGIMVHFWNSYFYTIMFYVLKGLFCSNMKSLLWIYLEV